MSDKEMVYFLNFQYNGAIRLLTEDEQENYKRTMSEQYLPYAIKTTTGELICRYKSMAMESNAMFVKNSQPLAA
ncbi:hypothetical protein M2146_001171 [Lachnospiraceae bacterium PF1-22]